MLTEAGCQARKTRLWELLPDHVEWVIIADPRHINYFSAFSVEPLSFSYNERALLVLDREKGATLLGDNYVLRKAANPYFVDREIMETWYDHKHSVINRDHALFAALGQISEELYGRSGTVEAEWLPVGAFEALALDNESHTTSIEPNDMKTKIERIDLGTLIRVLRRQKEADEIALLRECMKAGEAGHARAMQVAKAGVSELEVYREIQSAATAAAGRPCLVYGDFRACNAETPKQGGLPTDYPLQNGDMLVLDYSVILNGYRSDFTNTICIGEPTENQQKLFDLCLAGMKAGEAVLKAGVLAADVHKAVKAPYYETEWADGFMHHAGHGLGMAHPEEPILVSESTDSLLAGDVVTLEPGCYIEGIGGVRIEHNYLITETGYERLSHHTLSLVPSR